VSSRAAPPDAFGRTAREYELGRPGWPDELLDRVVPELDLGAAAEVLDVGAGTGKLTRALVPRFARVVAVEPDDEMRAVLEEVVPGAEALAGRGDAIPLDDDSVDAVFSGEAFHWFATGEAVAEIGRVLRPRGALVILWNIPLGYADLGPEVDALLDEAFERGGEPGLPRVLSGEWRPPIERGGFEPLREASVERDILRSREEWIANMLSVSSIAHQAAEARDELARGLRELIPPDARIRNPIRTEAHWTRRG
jgi:SAM-dependent methyltransferase